MIKVQSLIDQWEERLIDCQENTTERLIRDTISVLEFLEAPLTEQDRKDLDLMHRVRSGQVKKSVCKEYAIYNGDWYRDHPWNVPKEQEEPRLLTLEELMEIDPQTVLWDDIRDDQQDGPLDERGWMILHPVCFCGFDKIEIEPGQGKEEVVLFALGFDRVADYGKTFALWTGRPTEQQRRATPWPKPQGGHEDE